MAQPLHVAFTMDCERILAESPPGGPETWDLSGRAIHGFCEVLINRGILPTLFVVPECAQQHKGLLKDLASRGVELGLHIHPQSFGDHRYGLYLGQYSRSVQRQIILEGLEVFIRAIGERPASFRPGNFSVSSETFDILNGLGFRQGSASDPGRNCPDLAAVWKEAHQDPHWANARDPLKPGDLPLLEIPVTTDPHRLQANGFPHELRIESGGFRSWHEPIIRQTLQRMISEEVPFQCLCLFTHNCFEYGDPNAIQTKTLHRMLGLLDELSHMHQIIPANLAMIRNLFVEKLGEPQRS